MRRMILGIGGVVVAAVLCTAGLVTASGQEAQGQKEVAGQPAGNLQKYYFSNTYCNDCHGKKEVARDEFYLDFTRKNEKTIWDEQDKHRDATIMLESPRGKQIADRMGIKGDITKEQQCMSCHGVYLSPHAKGEEALRSKKELLINGVSCVMCHGAHIEWVKNHHTPDERDKWRKLNRQEKQSQQGMDDLWDPAVRAAVCAKCHVGNAKEGKVVTHDMYAAGHPPLPGFEAATFSHALPAHWETWDAKLKRLRERFPDDAAEVEKRTNLYKQAFQWDGKPNPTENSRLVVVSSVVAFKASVELVAGFAELHGANDKVWPDFALYDCYACHHDLKAKSWRQERGYLSKPGRPQLPQWPVALMPLAIRLSGEAAKKNDALFTQRRKDLEKVFGDSNFGDPKEIVNKGRSLVQWSNELLKELKNQPIDPAKSNQILALLLQSPKTTLMDFDSARQVGWALNAMQGELAPGLAENDKSKSAFAALEKQLRLKIDVGRYSIVDKKLPGDSAALAAYEAEEFRDEMAKIAASLPTAKAQE